MILITLTLLQLDGLGYYHCYCNYCNFYFNRPTAKVSEHPAYAPNWAQTFLAYFSGVLEGWAWSQARTFWTTVAHFLSLLGKQWSWSTERTSSGETYWSIQADLLHNTIPQLSDVLTAFV